MAENQIIHPFQIIDPDAKFFVDHPDRQAHIRNAHDKEFNGEFFSLGDHDLSRRRVLLWRAPKGNSLAGRLLKIPFLAFADESIEDTDAVLMPMINAIMEDAAEKYGVKRG